MSRRRQLALWAGAALVAVVVVLGWDQTAQAAPAAPEAPASLAAPAQPVCHWELRDIGNVREPVLRCEGGVDPTTVPEDQRPPMPSNCMEQRITHGLGDQGPTMEWRCTADGNIWIQCRNQDGLFGQDWLDYAWPDHEAWLQVPASSPQWWLDDIRIESEDARNGNNGMGCRLAEHPPTAPCAERNTSDPSKPDYYRSKDGLVPDRCWGTYPSNHYSMAWNDSGPFDFENKMLGWTGSFMFGLGKGAIVAVLWLVGWAFSFDITDYTTFSANIAESYQVTIVYGFDLQDIVWYFLVAWAGFAALRGKLGAAGGEILVAIVLAGVSTVLYSNRADYMDSVAKALDETSARLLVAGRHVTCVPENEPLGPGEVSLGRSTCREHEKLVRADTSRPATLEEEIRPLQQHIHRAFVEEPYAYLNWGRVTTDQCLTAQNEIVATGFNEQGWPERHMRRANCEELANFNRDPTTERMLGALLTMLAAFVTAFFLGLMALTVVISKFLIALLFAIMPFAALGAILPGSARRLAWSWLGTLVQLCVAVVSMSFLLALMLLGVDEVLRATEDIELIQRWFVVLLIVGAVYFGRRRLLSSTKGLGESVTDGLTRMTPAGANWSGSSKGIDMLGIDRGVKNTAIAGGWAAAAGGSYLALRLQERRIARRGYRNLERMERTRERPQVEYRHDGYRFHPTASTPASHGLPRGGTGPGATRPAGGRPRGGPAPRGGPRSGSGGRPAHVPENFERTPGGGWTGPADDYRSHGAAGAARGSGGPRPGPGPVGAGRGRPAAPSGPAERPAPIARERWEVVMKVRTPPPFLTHPLGNIGARIRRGTPMVGTKAQLRRTMRSMEGPGTWTGGGPVSRAFRPGARRRWNGWP